MSNLFYFLCFVIIFLTLVNEVEAKTKKTTPTLTTTTEPSTTSTAAQSTTRKTKKPKRTTTTTTTTTTTQPSTTTTAAQSTTRKTKKPKRTTRTTTTQPTTTTTIVPPCGNNGMNPSARKAFLLTHNRLRSRLANGNAMNGDIGMAPQAANMLKMKYDCNAEASAMAAALTCSGQLSPPETRPGYKENFIKIHKTYLNLPQTATHASERWWHQLSQHGANGHMLFTHEMRVEKTKIIRNWGKMAWHNNARLGCAVARCNGFSFVVCHYTPGGNNIGENFYTVGAPCSMCPQGTKCDNATKLCE